MIINSISNNPFRILGVYSNSSLKDRVANNNRINAFAKIGKEITFPHDFNELINDKPKRTLASLEHANRVINLDKDRLVNSLFWFINTSPYDEIALKNLQLGNIEKAKEIFRKKESFSTLINGGVLALAEGDQATGIANISKVLHNSSYLSDFLTALDMVNLTITENELSEMFITELLKEISAKDLMPFVTYDNDKNIIAKKALEGPISKINQAIATAKSTPSSDADANLKAGMYLMESTKKMLEEVIDIVGKNDIEYQMVADNLAKQILQCGINYYNNASETDVESPRKAMVLQSYALSIAVAQLTKDRCQKNVGILQEIIDSLPPQGSEKYVCKIDALLGVLSENFDPCTILTIQRKIMLYCGIIKSVVGEYCKFYSILENKIVHTSLNLAIEFINNSINQGQSLRWNRALYIVYEFIINLDEYKMNSEISSWYKTNIDAIKAMLTKDSYYNAIKKNNFIQSEYDYYNNCKTIDDYNIYLEVYPNGEYYEYAKGRIKDLQQKEQEKEEAERRKQNELKRKIQTFISIDQCIECISSHSLTPELRHRLDDRAYFFCKNGNEDCLQKYLKKFSDHRTEVEFKLREIRREKEQFNSVIRWVALYAIVGLILYLIIG